MPKQFIKSSLLVFNGAYYSVIANTPKSDLHCNSNIEYAIIDTILHYNIQIHVYYNMV